MINFYFKGWRQTFNFRGRSNRKEFWSFVLWDICFLYGSGALSYFLDFLANNSLALEEKMPYAIVLTIIFEYSAKLFIFLCAGLFIGGIITRVSIAVRRLHDIGRSGFWFLIQIIPIISLIVLYWYIQPSYDKIKIK